jgi:hypothetical protein
VQHAYFRRHAQCTPYCNAVCAVVFVVIVASRTCALRVVLVQNVFVNNPKYVDISKQGVVPPNGACQRAVFEVGAAVLPQVLGHHLMIWLAAYSICY